MTIGKLTCPRLFGQIESRLPAASEPFVGFFRHIETEMFFSRTAGSTGDQDVFFLFQCVMLGKTADFLGVPSSLNLSVYDKYRQIRTGKA